jgi:hypothetical protein
MLASLALLFLILFSSTPVFGATDATYLTINNPVRGSESWQAAQTSLSLVEYQYHQATQSALPVTWLLRYDSLADPTHQTFFSSLDNPLHRLGAFIEITPNLALDAGVDYDKNSGIFSSHNVFLNGYRPEDRYKLIDTYMAKFQKTYGYTPRVVGAWYIDAQSLAYLRQKYSVIAVINCDEQYETDQYRLWGGHIGSSYIPSARHALQPSPSRNNRIDLVISRWAQRDLFNFYGRSKASLFSLQINDYPQLGLDHSYFQSLVSLYQDHTGHDFSAIHIGLENDDVSPGNRLQIAENYRFLKAQIDQGRLRLVFIEDYSSDMLRFYPVVSPQYAYLTSDPTSRTDGDVYWYQSHLYRIGLRQIGEKTEIIDLRLYHPTLYEEFYDTPNTSSFLYAETPYIIDTVKHPDSSLSIIGLKGPLDLLKRDGQVTLLGQTGSIVFSENTIRFVGLGIDSPDTSDIKISQEGTDTLWSIKVDKEPIVPLYLAFIIGLMILAIIYFRYRSYALATAFVVVILPLMTMFRSGTTTTTGLGFWGPNSHDGIFHLSFIEKFARDPLDLSHPHLAGETITNYHLVYDYVLGLVTRLTSISSLDLYFRFAPFVMAIGLIYLLALLMNRLRLTQRAQIFAFIIAFLGGSFGYLVSFVQYGNLLSGESAFWMHQSVSIFLNPPFALSIILLVWFFYLYRSPQGRSVKLFLSLLLLGVILAQTKVYAFILLALGLFLVKDFVLAGSILALGYLINLPFSDLSGFPFQLSPFWFVQSMFASLDRLNLPIVSQAWSSYLSQPDYLKLFILVTLASLIYLVGNLGMRVLALPHFLATRQSPEDKLIKIIILIGLVIPFVMIQRHNPWNTIQFSYYSLFFLSLYTAKTLDRIARVRFGPYLIPALIIVSVFSSFATLRDYLTHLSSGRVSYSEMGLFDRLSTLPPATLISPVFSPDRSRFTPSPKPLHNYTSTSYISALSGQAEYFADTVNLDITGFDYTVRLRDVTRLYQTTDRVWAGQFLDQNDIRYLVEWPDKRMSIHPFDLGFVSIYDQSGYTLYSRK